MSILAARQTKYPYLTGSAQAGRVQAGTPAQPYALLDGSVQFEWELQIGAVAASGYQDFSGTYPGEEFTFGGNPWVTLLNWNSDIQSSARVALLILEVYLAWGPGVVSPTTLDASSFRARLSGFDSALSTNDDDDRFEVTTVISAGSLKAAKLAPKSATETLILNGETGGSDRSKLALQVRNTGGSAFTGGNVRVIVLAREIG